MKILILQGPNLNLLGLKSSESKNNLTLSKLNKAIKLHFKDLDLNFKIFQTHKQFQAINILQRNRNWANGILVIPTSWARYNYTILETINLINKPTSLIYFNEAYSFGSSEKNTILIGGNIKSFTGEPVKACIEGIKYLIK
tara:strand:- start:2329 stop:2751 length:423 start_codon:yes stop_codon:yes gene_type:complete